MSDATKPCPWPLNAGSIGDRITYTHSPIVSAYPPESRELPNAYGESSLDNDSLAVGGGSANDHPLSQTAGDRVGVSVQNDDKRTGEREAREGLERRRGTRGDVNALPIGNPDGKSIGSGSSHGSSKSSYALVTVLSEPTEASIDAVLVQPPGAKQQVEVAAAVVDGQTLDESPFKDSLRSLGVTIILGPVVGKVEVVMQSGGVRSSCRVPVILEVDGDAAITCVVSSSSR